MRLYPILTWFAFVLAGCSTTVELPRNPNEYTVTEVNRRLHGCVVKVNHVDGHAVFLDSTVLSPRSIAGVYADLGGPVTIPQTEIERFYADDSYNPRGAILGALIGATSGVVATYLFGPAIIEIFDLPVWGDYPVNLTPIAYAGAAVGGIVGLIIGDNLPPEEYVFSDLAGADLPQELSRTLHSRLLTLQLTSFQDETPDQICIKWDGRFVWLPKSNVKLQRVGDYILLTVPESLLRTE